MFANWPVFCGAVGLLVVGLWLDTIAANLEFKEFALSRISRAQL